MRCKDCRYWENPSFDDVVEKQTGSCKGIPFRYDCEEWIEQEDGDYLNKLKEGCRDRLAFTHDASMYIAWLETCAEFGCVHFEPKEQ